MRVKFEKFAIDACESTVQYDTFMYIVHNTYTLVTYVRRCHLGDCVFQSYLNFANLKLQVVESVSKDMRPMLLISSSWHCQICKINTYYSRKGWGPVMSDYNNI